MRNLLKQIINGTYRNGNKVDFGSLRKLTPVSECWGFDRGRPVDRYYIENFLERHQEDIQGTVLEIQNNRYTVRYGGDKVLCSETLDNESSNPTTYHLDLRNSQNLPKDRFDCILFTQTLQLVDDINAVIKNLYDMLKTGGVLLCTIPTVSKIAVEEDCDYWRFTKAGAQYLFKKQFNESKLYVEAFGNIFISICFLEGIAVEEIDKEELEYFDKNFPLLVCVRATK